MLGGESTSGEHFKFQQEFAVRFAVQVTIFIRRATELLAAPGDDRLGGVEDASSMGSHELSALEKVKLVSTGKVRRHKDRGEDEPSLTEKRAAEDSASRAGARNPAQLMNDWPEYPAALAPVRRALLEAWEADAELRELASACGDQPLRLPPSASAVTVARCRVAAALGIADADAELHHPASPWRPKIVEAIGAAALDPDVHIVAWLLEGAPCGLARPIPVGTLLPQQPSDASLSLDELGAVDRVRANHPSFGHLHGDSEPPALKLLSELVDSGFGRLYADQAAAEKHLGCEVFPAQLGNVAKQRPDGTMKHRLIMDLRRNRVNDAVILGERQVLPRFVDHAADLARLSLVGDLGILVIDYKHAFMTIPLHPAEQPYMCSSVPEGLSRSRPALDEEEVQEGTFIVWRVLGFGGKPSPLLYSRVASFASRSAQALLIRTPASEKLASVAIQLYVDDPAVVLAGREANRAKSVDLILLYWLVLGIPIAWAKGRYLTAPEGHTWIGVVFSLIAPGVARMTLPKEFVDELLENLKPFCEGCGHVALKLAEQVVGRCGRVAHVVPEARPFASMFYGALAGSKRAARLLKREVPPDRVAARRFKAGALWMRALLQGDDGAPLPLHADFWHQPPAAADLTAARVEFDASPWGGGAVYFKSSKPWCYFSIEWTPCMFLHEAVIIGDCRFQTLFELSMLFLALEAWAEMFPPFSLAMLGDNVASLQAALSLTGKGSLK